MRRFSQINESRGGYRNSISKKFNAIEAHLDTIHTMTKPGSVLHKKIKDSGGDTSWLKDLHNHIKAAHFQHEDAHRGSVSHLEDEAGHER